MPPGTTHFYSLFRERRHTVKDSAEETDILNDTEEAAAVSVTVGESDAGMRLDRFAAEAAGISRSAAVRMTEEGRVTVNGEVKDKKYPVKSGDTVVVFPPPPAMPDRAEPENIPLDIVYEDRDLLVVNKPSGMVVHPAPGNPTGTLVNALLFHCGNDLSGIGGVLRPGIVHRLDKDTGGLLVVAKNDRTHAALSKALETHDVEREYRAVVSGGFRNSVGTVDLPIGRHPVDRKRMAVVANPAKAARRAVTHYEVLEQFGLYSYLKLRLETGRTHQIRVHMSHIGHPLLGDAVYGGRITFFGKKETALLHGQVLFAKKLSFIHPTTGERLVFEVDLPEDFESILDILRAGTY